MCNNAESSNQTNNLTQKNDKYLYKNAFPAFFNNEIESDKLIVVVSLAIIGFLLSVLLDANVKITMLLMVCIGISLICFFVTTIMIIFIFKYNKEHMLNIMRGNLTSEHKCLKHLDDWKYGVFLIGIVCLLFASFFIFYDKINQNERNNMSNKNEIKQNLTPLEEGFSGTSKIAKIKEIQGSEEVVNLGFSGTSDIARPKTNETKSKSSENNDTKKE